MEESQGRSLVETPGNPESQGEDSGQAQKEFSDSQSFVQAVGRGVHYRPTHGEYTLAPEWRRYALQQLGVRPEEVVLDLFASRQRAAALWFITKEMDAFTYNWSLLSEGGKETLWANPPFYLIEKVVGKIWQERSRIVLCHPDWQEASWWEPLLTLVKAGVTMPEGQSLYYGVVKKEILPPPRWRTCVRLVESDGSHGPYPISRISEWLDKRCLQRDRPYVQQQAEALLSCWEQDSQDTGVPAGPQGLSESPRPHGKGLEEGGGTPCQERDKKDSKVPRPPVEDPRAFSGLGVKVVGSQKEGPSTCEVYLKIPVVLKAQGMDPAQARVLIDTGAEVSLIRKGLLPDAMARMAERPLRLVAANSQRLPGGKQVAQVQLQFEAVEVDSQKRVLVTAPSTLYLAEMEEDVIR